MYLCGGALLPILQAVYELQTGPRFIAGTDFHIDEAVSQGDGADDVLRQVRRHLRVSFWPGDPDAPIPRDGVLPSGEPRLQVRPRPNERVDEVDGAVQALPNRHPFRDPTQSLHVVLRRTDHGNDEARLDSE